MLSPKTRIALIDYENIGSLEGFPFMTLTKCFSSRALNRKTLKFLLRP
jgi:hypothetical protein